MLSGPDAFGPMAVVIPLDGLFEDRVDAAYRLWRLMTRRGRVKPSGLTLQRRRRLKLVLRALDGHLAGEDYRGVARGVLNTRVPTDAAWRTDASRSLVIRLVREGRALMLGGYLRLLRPERRRR